MPLLHACLKSSTARGEEKKQTGQRHTEKWASAESESIIQDMYLKHRRMLQIWPAAGPSGRDSLLAVVQATSGRRGWIPLQGWGRSPLPPLETIYLRCPRVELVLQSSLHLTANGLHWQRRGERERQRMRERERGRERDSEIICRVTHNEAFGPETWQWYTAQNKPFTCSPKPGRIHLWHCFTFPAPSKNTL